MNIDRIAREMVDIEPSVDLEARIRARLNVARPEQRPVWLTWRLGVPIAAAAAIAIASVVQRPEVRVQGPASMAKGPESSVHGPESRVQTAATRGLPAEARSAKVSATSKRSKPASQLSSEELAWMDRRIPALDSVNSLQVDHLRVDAIQPEPLSITPLTMTPVATESGGIERRNDH